MYELLEVEGRINDREINLNKMRKDGYIPGVIFGKEMDSLSIKILEKKLLKQLSHKAKIIELLIDGRDKMLVNIESIQKHAVSGKVLHVSFLKMAKGQKAHVTVPIVLTGHSHGVIASGTVTQSFEELTISGLPQDLPQSIDIDVSLLTLDSRIHLSDIVLPSGIVLADKHSSDTVVVSVHPTHKAEEEPVKAPKGEVAKDAEGATDKKDAEAEA